MLESEPDFLTSPDILYTR